MADLLERLQSALGAGHIVEREIGDGRAPRAFIATERATGKRSIIRVASPTAADEPLHYVSNPYSDQLARELYSSPVVGGTGLSGREITMGATAARRRTAWYAAGTIIVVLIAAAVILRAPAPDRSRLETMRRLEEQVRTLEGANELANAEAGARNIIAVEPQAPSGWSLLGGVLLAEHQNDSAISALHRALALEGSHATPSDVAYLSYAFSVAKERDSALAYQRQLEAQAGQEFVSPAALAIAELGAGHRDSAVALFTRAFNDHDAYMGQIFPADPVFDTLRSDPRMIALKRRAHLT